MKSDMKLLSFMFNKTAICAGLVLANSAYVSAGNGPEITGRLNTAIVSAGSHDIDVRAIGAHLGISHLEKLDNGMKLKYELVADFSGEINGTDANGQVYTSGDRDNSGDVYVETAKMVLITKAGVLVYGPRLLSGQWKQIYSGVDKFEYNRMHGQMGQSAIFGQPYQVGNVIAYASPELAPGLKFVGAVLTPIDYNDDDVDVKSARLVYKKGALSAAVGRVWYSSEFPNIGNYERTALGASYDFGKLNLGAVYEGNKEIANEYDSYAVVADMKLSDTIAVTLGYANKSADNEAANKTGMIGKLKYKTSKKTYMYIEGGSYEGDGDINFADNVLFGMNAKF